MKTTFLVGVDGSDGARRAAEYAARRAQAEGARLILAHVVDWSPYELLTPEELASRHIERQQEIDESLAKILKPLAGDLAPFGVDCELVVRHGHATECLCDIAREADVSQVFTGRRGRSRLATLLFGSVSGSLVQVCPVPITVVP